MSLSEKQVELVDKIYRDPSIGLFTPDSKLVENMIDKGRSTRKSSDRK